MQHHKTNTVWVYRRRAALLVLALAGAAQAPAEDIARARPVDSYAAQTPAWHDLDDSLALDDESLGDIAARGVGAHAPTATAEEVFVILWDESRRPPRPVDLHTSDGGLTTQATLLQAQRH